MLRIRDIDTHPDPHYLYLWLTDPDPDPATFVSDLQDGNKFFFFLSFLPITFWSHIYIIFQRWKVVKKSQNSTGTNKGSSVLRIRIRDWVLFWPLDPGWKKVSIRIRDPGWRQFESGIRDGKKSDPGSGINIPDPQHWLVLIFLFFSLLIKGSRSGSAPPNPGGLKTMDSMDPQHC